jgi:hypothetical protein
MASAIMFLRLSRAVNSEYDELGVEYEARMVEVQKYSVKISGTETIEEEDCYMNTSTSRGQFNKNSES